MRPFVVAVFIAASLAGAAQQQTRLSTDIIDTYTSMIASKPDNCDLYLSRALEYLSQGLTSPALSDLNDALRLCPKGDKDLRFEILSQRASVYEIQMDYTAALADLEAAAALKPDVPSLTVARARIFTGLGRYREARDEYNRYRRVNPRDASTLFGLAKVSALDGDTDAALAYANDAVEIAPRAGKSYLSLADLYILLGRSDEAITACIRAIDCNDDASGDALQKLVDMSRRSFPGVTGGLDKAINDNPSTGILYYIRAAIAQDHEHHASALADYDVIDGSGPFAGGALASSIAESLLALDLNDEALQVLRKAPAVMHDSEWHTLRAVALHRLGRNEDALTEIDSALALDADNVDAMEQRARILIALNRAAEASTQLAAAIMTEPSHRPLLYLLRSTVAPESLCDNLIEGAADLVFDPDDPASLRGFALLALGKTDEATVWANNLTRLSTAGDGVAMFTAACVLARADKPDEALNMLEAAIAAGYDNRHAVLSDTTPFISLEPLRSHKRFTSVTAPLQKSVKTQ